MTTPKAIRDHIRKSWFEAIQNISDLNVQKQKWVDSDNSNPYYSFVECMCMYFDDLGLSDQDYEQWIQQGIITETEYKLVKSFHEQLAVYKPPTNEWDHEAILRDPAWITITKLAQKTLKELHSYQLSTKLD
jgi:hypothetical protein